MVIVIAAVVLHVDGVYPVAQNLKLLPLRHILKICVSDIEAAFNEGTADKVAQLGQIGCVIDPVNSGDAHFVEVFDKDINSAFFGGGYQLLEELLITAEALLLSDAFLVAGMNYNAVYAQFLAGLDTADVGLNKGSVALPPSLWGRP